MMAQGKPTLRSVAFAAVASTFLIEAGPVVPTKEEQALMSPAYSECLRTAAEQVDDGRTEMAVMGQVIAMACKAQFEQMVATLGRNLSAQDRQALSEKLSDLQIGFAAVVIDKLREQRAPAPRR